MYGTFVGCKFLENVTNIPEGCDDIQEIYYGCSSLNNVNVVIPGNVKKIYNSFRDCSNLSGKIII